MSEVSCTELANFSITDTIFKKKLWPLLFNETRRTKININGKKTKKEKEFRKENEKKKKKLRKEKSERAKWMRGKEMEKKTMEKKGRFKKLNFEKEINLR